MVPGKGDLSASINVIASPLFFFFFFFFCGRCFLHLFRNQWQASWENFSLLSQSVHLFLRHTHTNSTQLMKQCCLLLSFLLSSSCTCAGCTIPLWYLPIAARFTEDDGLRGVLPQSHLNTLTDVLLQAASLSLSLSASLSLSLSLCISLTLLPESVNYWRYY